MQCTYVALPSGAGRLVSCSWDKTLRVWRTDSFGAAIATLKGQSGGLAWAWLGTRFALPVTAARYRAVRTGASAALRLCGGLGADWIIVRCVGPCQPRL